MRNGIIRHISRLQNACIPTDAKSPIFLPSRGDITRLVLTNIHHKHFHCGKDQTLSLVRQRYWLPRASGSFKTYLRDCAVCKRWQGLPFGSPNMPPLPTDRVVITKPFRNIGCDFIGPFFTKSDENMYICLYTCLTTRAVHLEVVENMSAGAFLNSFIRFVSRRGVPHIVRSDYGANFRLFSKIIIELSQPADSTGCSVMSYAVSLTSSRLARESFRSSTSREISAATTGLPACAPSPLDLLSDRHLPNASAVDIRLDDLEVSIGA
ncbi:hypothetical protein OSTOST_04934 [Ostertagia ostertagi]